jgi:hypothetical protein
MHTDMKVVSLATAARWRHMCGNMRKAWVQFGSSGTPRSRSTRRRPDWMRERRFPLCRSQPLAQLFSGTGMHDVQVRAIDVPTVFRDFDDYWSPFLSGQGPAPGYAMALTEERRVMLRERIHASLPIEPDGSIHLTARAWAARGTS